MSRGTKEQTVVAQLSITDKAIERLASRIETVSNLFARGIVNGALLRKQIKSILNNADSNTVYKDLIEPNRKALKILHRLEDPKAWRKIFTASPSEREEAFYSAIEDILRNSSAQSEKIIMILEVASLPFYSSLFPNLSADRNERKLKKTSRVSVLD